MYPDTKDKRNNGPWPVPLPRTPHFDAASIEQAQPVEPLRRRRLINNPSRVLRFAVVILASLLFVVVELTTVAHLNRQLDKSSSAPEIGNAAVATAVGLADPSIKDVSAEAPSNTSAVAPIRKEGIRRKAPGPKVFYVAQEALPGKPRPRLVAVIH